MSNPGRVLDRSMQKTTVHMQTQTHNHTPPAVQSDFQSKAPSTWCEHSQQSFPIERGEKNPEIIQILNASRKTHMYM